MHGCFSSPPSGAHRFTSDSQKSKPSCVTIFARANFCTNLFNSSCAHLSYSSPAPTLSCLALSRYKYVPNVLCSKVKPVTHTLSFFILVLVFAILIIFWQCVCRGIKSLVDCFWSSEDSKT